MALISFRELDHQFGHVDGEIKLLDAHYEDDKLEVKIVTRFYPWMEHPLFRKAVENKEPWGFTDYSEGERDMPIYAVNPVKLEMDGCVGAEDIWFIEDDPSLWPYQNAGSVFINSPLDVSALIDCLAANEEVSGKRSDIERLIGHCCAYDPPFKLSYLPFAAFNAALDELDRLEVEYYPKGKLTEKWQWGKPHAILELTGLTCIAQDFMLDVPEFEHRDEWFKPIEP